MTNMTVAKSTPISEGYQSRLAAGWGFFTELQLNSAISLRLGVEYSELGGKKEGMQALPTQRLITEIGSGLGLGMTTEQQMALGSLMMWSKNNPYYYVNVKNTAKFEYVTVPLMAQFGANIGQSPWRVYVNAGPFAAFLLSGKQVASGTSKLYSDDTGATTLWNYLPAEVRDFVTTQFPDMDKKLGEDVHFGTTNITGELKSTNFGITGNLGIRYRCNRNYFFLEVGGNYGFVTIQDDSSNGSNRLGATSVMLGYAFSLF